MPPLHLAVTGWPVFPLSGRLWYLTPELITLSFYEDVPDAEKRLIVLTLLQIPRPPVVAPGKPGQPQFNPAALKLTAHTPPLANFILENL